MAGQKNRNYSLHKTPHKIQCEHQKTQKGQHLADLNEEQARDYIERLIWPDGKPICPHCGSIDAYRMQGESCRPGLCRCRDCKKQFTVTVGTIFEDTHIPLRKWIRAFHLMCSSKKGISALQLQRNLGLGSYKTAWHLAHRIRLAMRSGSMENLLSGIVESDECWIGGKPRPKHNQGTTGKPGHTDKQPVLVLVERNGRKRTRVIPEVTAHNLRSNINLLVDKKNSTLMTDENRTYGNIGKEFGQGHQTVNHGAYEYYRHSDGAGINTAESGFALIKRGMYGTFHHVSVKHLQRYLDEFDFRWDHRKTSDVERTRAALEQTWGKRLMYSQVA